MSEQKQIALMIKKAKDMLDRDGTLEIISCHVSNGGSLIQLADAWGIRYSDLSSWVRADNRRIKRLQEAMVDRAEWSKDRILEELRTLSFTDITKIIDDNGDIRPVNEWPQGLTRAVASFDVKTEVNEEGETVGTIKKVKFYSKEKALELLGRNIQLFTDKIEVSGKVTLEDLIGASYEGARDVTKDSSE